jgi:alpha-glucosidase
MVPYLKDIGVGAVWLSPIYQSPGKDFGYDISDYENIDPIFGTMDDFETLAKNLTDAGLYIVLKNKAVIPTLIIDDDET